MIDIDVTFESLSEWLEWVSANPFAFDISNASEVAERIKARGFLHPLTKRFVPSEGIHWSEGAIREGLVADGINSRQRAVI